MSHTHTETVHKLPEGHPASVLSHVPEGGAGSGRALWGQSLLRPGSGGSREGASSHRPPQTIPHTAVVSSLQGAEMSFRRLHALRAEWGTSTIPNSSCHHLRNTCVWLSCSGGRSTSKSSSPVPPEAHSTGSGWDRRQTSLGGKGPPPSTRSHRGHGSCCWQWVWGQPGGWCRVWAHRCSACRGPAAGVPPTRGHRRRCRPQPRPHPKGGSGQGGHCLGHLTPATPSARAVYTVRGFSNHCRGGLAGPRPGAHGVPASESARCPDLPLR